MSRVTLLHLLRYTSSSRLFIVTIKKTTEFVNSKYTDVAILLNFIQRFPNGDGRNLYSVWVDVKDGVVSYLLCVN